MTAALLGALLAAAAVALLVPAGPRWPDRSEVERATSAPDRSLLVRMRWLVTLLSAAGAWAMVGGPAGLVAAVVAGAAVWVVLGRSEPPSVVRRRERLRAELPVAVDLVASCLDGGAAPESALSSVAEALGGPVGEEFQAICHRLRVGVDPERVWREVGAHPQLGPLGQCVGRAHETGAAVGQAVHRLSAELRDRARAEVEERARSIEVKASVPLGVCLLPAFVLLGVVPLVVGVFTSMHPFG